MSTHGTGWKTRQVRRLGADKSGCHGQESRFGELHRERLNNSNWLKSVVFFLNEGINDENERDANER